MVKFFNEVHPSKASPPIFLSLVGRTGLLRLLHLLKARAAISASPSGNDMDCKLTQPKKAPKGITATAVFSMETMVSKVQFMNACFPKERTEGGNSKPSRLLHHAKASAPIETSEGTTTTFSVSHRSNIAVGINFNPSASNSSNCLHSANARSSTVVLFGIFITTTPHPENDRASRLRTASGIITVSLPSGLQ